MKRRLMNFVILLVSSLFILIGCTGKKGDVELIWRNLSNKKCNATIGLSFDYPSENIENDYEGIGVWGGFYEGIDDKEDFFLAKVGKTKWLKTGGRLIPYAIALDVPFHFADYETPAYPGKVEFFITDGADNSVHTVKSKIDGKTLKVSGINLWVVE